MVEYRCPSLTRLSTASRTCASVNRPLSAVITVWTLTPLASSPCGPLKIAFTESRHVAPAAGGDSRGSRCGERAAFRRGTGRFNLRGSYAVVRVAVHNFQKVVGDFVEVGDGSEVERDHASGALEHADVAVHADILANTDRALLRAVFSIHPPLDVDRAGAVVDGVLLCRRADVCADHLAEKSQVVHLLAVHFERVVLGWKGLWQGC